jgi:hypothetical protein
MEADMATRNEVLEQLKADLVGIVHDALKEISVKLIDVKKDLQLTQEILEECDPANQ